MDKLNTNIKIGYLISFLFDFYFPVSVWIFFYLRFMTYQQVAIVAAFQLIVWNLFEVPTGAFADLVGRKISIIIGFFLYAVCMLVTAFTTHFWIFMIIEFFKGLSNALNSGSLEALVYDSLKEHHQEHRWDKIVSNNETLVWIGLFISSIIGGFLYHWNYQSPYLLQVVVYTLAGLVALRLYEPKLDSIKYHWKVALVQNAKGFKELFANVTTTHKTLTLALLGAGYVIAANILGITQAKQYGMDSRGVGILFATGYLISATASQFYPRLKAKLGAAKVLLLAGSVLLASFLLANFVGVIIGSLLIISRIASSTTYRNARSSVVNNFVTSKNRATALSAMQLLTQIPYAVLAYWIGAYIDHHSPNQFALILGVSLVILLAINHFGFKAIKTYSLSSKLS